MLMVMMKLALLAGRGWYASAHQAELQLHQPITADIALEVCIFVWSHACNTPTAQLSLAVCLALA